MQADLSEFEMHILVKSKFNKAVYLKLNSFAAYVRLNGVCRETFYAHVK